MRIFLSLIGITLSILMIIYREKVATMIGEGEWMDRIGGVYNVVVLVAILLFFWSVAELTGTRELFFRPLLFLVPGGVPDPVETF